MKNTKKKNGAAAKGKVDPGDDPISVHAPRQRVQAISKPWDMRTSITPWHPLRINLGQLAPSHTGDSRKKPPPKGSGTIVKHRILLLYYLKDQ